MFTIDKLSTHIDEVVVVSDEEVPQYPGLVQVPEADHVLHPLHRGRVHRLDPPLGGEPQLLPVIVHHLRKYLVTNKNI